MIALLKKLNIKCDIANNGLEAVDMVKLFNYPLILMDIGMYVYRIFLEIFIFERLKNIEEL